MRYASFVLRLWQPEVSEADPMGRALHGRIEHVQTGRSVPVASWEDVTEFIREQLIAAQSNKEPPSNLTEASF